MAIDLDKVADRKLTVLMSEYKQANTEIAERLKMQKQVEQLVIVLIGALFTGGSFMLQYDLLVILPLSTILFCVLSISFFEQDINITVLASYCHKVLRTEMQKILHLDPKSHNLLTWETFRKEAYLKSSASKYLTINRTSLLYIPPVIPVGIFLYIRLHTPYINTAWSTLEILALVGAVLSMLFLAYFAMKIPNFYNEIVSYDINQSNPNEHVSTKK